MHGNLRQDEVVNSPLPWRSVMMPRYYLIVSGAPRADVIAKVLRMPRDLCLHAKKDVDLILSIPQLIDQIRWLVVNPTEGEREKGAILLESLGFPLNPKV